MSHKDPTNQQPETSHHGKNTLTEDSFKEQQRATPAAMWQTFRAYSKITRNETVTAYEDKDAKAISRQRRNERLWIQSSEKNSAAFDIQSVNVSIDIFLESLSAQYPEAIGGVDTQQGSTRGTDIAFDSQEARDKACSIGIQISSMTIIGTPTLSSESSVFRISLDKLPILRPSDLSPMLQDGFKQYGKVLHVGLYLDHKTKLFIGKGYVMLDTAREDEIVYKALTHEISFGQQRIILATWRGMGQHCFYCHKPGHTKNDCQSLQRQRVKTCFACGSTEHLVRDCPKTGSPTVGDKRARTMETWIPESGHNNKPHKPLSPELNAPSKNHNETQFTSASKYATKDHVGSNTGVTTSTEPTNGSMERNVCNSSNDNEDADYVPSSASDMSSDDSNDDDMMIDEEEILDLHKEAKEAEEPKFQSQEREANAHSSTDDKGANNTNL